MLPASSTPLYYAADMLGSSRMIFNSATGTPCYDADFGPFGEERTYLSTCPQNYKFEGKERDTETGNDDFGARNYSWRFGRWLSSDWSSVPVPVPYANLLNPQTLNLYSMVSDDPESFADLDGHEDTTPAWERSDGQVNPCTGSGGPNDCSAQKPQPPNPQGKLQLSDSQKPPQPPPSDKDGKPTPPPVPVPGCPTCGWKWNPDPQNPRGGTWGPDGWKGANPPSGSWDPDGHWDIDKGGKGPRDHYDPQGNPLTPGQAHPGNAPAQQTMLDRMRSITPGPIARWGTAGVIIYILIDEGSRLYPPRNLVPVP